MSYGDITKDNIMGVINKDEIKRIIREEHPGATEDQVNETADRVIKSCCHSMRKEIMSIDSSGDDVVKCAETIQKVSRHVLSSGHDEDEQLKFSLGSMSRYYSEQGIRDRARDYDQGIKNLDAASKARADALRDIDTDATSDLTVLKNNRESGTAILRQAIELVENESR